MLTLPPEQRWTHSEQQGCSSAGADDRAPLAPRTQLNHSWVIKLTVCSRAGCKAGPAMTARHTCLKLSGSAPSSAHTRSPARTARVTSTRVQIRKQPRSSLCSVRNLPSRASVLGQRNPAAMRARGLRPQPSSPTALCVAFFRLFPQNERPGGYLHPSRSFTEPQSRPSWPWSGTNPLPGQPNPTGRPS